MSALLWYQELCDALGITVLPRFQRSPQPVTTKYKGPRFHRGGL